MLPMDTQNASDIVFKAVKLAGLKAVGIMMSSSSNISKNCLCAVAVASRILAHFDVAFTVVTGYTHMPGTEQSFPHAWLETPGGYITDLTFSGPYRKVIILGWAVGFHDEAVRAVYTASPTYTVDASKSLPVAVLRQQAEDIGGYVFRAPLHVQAAIKESLLKAMDGSDKLELKGVSEELLRNLQPGE
jgi:hypothetical protein